MGVVNKQVLQKTPRFSIITTLKKKYSCFFDDLFNHIVEQTYKDFECLIIVDEDDIAIPNLDNRFRVIYVNPQWLSTKRNIGINESKGEYLIFCDADDYLDINLLNNCNRAISLYYPDVVFPKVTRNESKLSNNDNQTICILKDKEVKDFFFSRYTESFARDDYMRDGCWGRAYKKKLLIDHDIHFIEEPCRAEDAIFNNDVALSSVSMALLSGYYGYFWRINKGSEMNNLDSHFFNIFPFGENLKRQICIYNPDLYENALFYLGNLLYGQIYLFYDNWHNRIIKRIHLIKKINSFLPQKSFCLESIESLSKNTKKGFKKLFLRAIVHRRYRLGMLLFKIYKSRNKQP